MGRTVYSENAIFKLLNMLSQKRMRKAFEKELDGTTEELEDAAIQLKKKSDALKDKLAKFCKTHPDHDLCQKRKSGDSNLIGVEK